MSRRKTNYEENARLWEYWNGVLSNLLLHVLPAEVRSRDSKSCWAIHVLFPSTFGNTLMSAVSLTARWVIILSLLAVIEVISGVTEGVDCLWGLALSTELLFTSGDCSFDQTSLVPDDILVVCFLTTVDSPLLELGRFPLNLSILRGVFSTIVCLPWPSWSSSSLETFDPVLYKSER